MLFIASVLFFSSCKEVLQNTSTDFTKESEFSSGIEGPATDTNGTIYAVNFKKEGTIGKVDANENASLFIKLPNGSIGNGIRFDKKGTMFIADYTNHNILQIKKGADKATVFASFTDFGLDGMRCDNKGKLHVCRYDKGTVAVFSPLGELIREVQLTGKKPTNITFGGNENKFCYVTLADRGYFEVFAANNPERKN